MVTIQEVAKRAGVSVATVSRVINNRSKVKEKTRNRVEQAIDELNYEPSVLGRNLRNSESRLLLVLIPSISNPFYTEIINGIEDTSIKEGYNILLCETDSNPKREAIYFNLVRNRMADGIILMDPTINRKNVLELATNHPIVQCSEFDKEGNISYVSIDNELAAYQAVKHLIKIGKKRIAFINSDEKFLYARERRAGYEKAFREFNIAVEKKRIYNINQLNFESGQQAMRTLLNQEEKPDAVFAVSDVLAIGALKEIHANGLKVPDDIAIIGFDKISFSNMTHPTLTTVSQPMYRMGCISASMLINKIKGEEVESMLLEHELVIREST
ncbi:MAG: LacI family DNA-binding transcriptional regulator [Bacillota bacterium]|uniref:LacI family DNA-binding transcriptional regulator n=1 Tax=Virgibacillus salarius TaxID=447199 RepID=A0A941DSA9_9BACI|nr:MULTISPECIES: LacI family DNA-binding transcriptional regulator [Bacillaceae]NAZ08398.1 substrate-binding domain-containing protein [Agaribacter marinus]MBR7795685.1 LacI family DNA-binding transcriptional regulator [Virgibacillus salarius]MCC2248607.1 LacI family DNA-binding transcriptional regulator [Virgibacillus sp. AGTR]MDY7043189.1 LacI family DNA-binding transcriptional regulator [Virgibacillus sp. M23]QRZ18364.1 LacI family DNA-binding transcriptional regulator [Virgibacillus sp. AG